MSLKHGLLGLLNYNDMTGYELGKAFHDSLSFFWQAQSSQIYRELNKLEEQGHLSSRIEFQTDKPNKRVYSITQCGREELHTWLYTKMPDEIMPTRSEVLMRLFFASLKTKEDTLADLKRIEQDYRSYLSQFSGLSAIIDNYSSFSESKMDSLYWEFTADFGRAYSEMCIQWAKKCAKRLEEVEE